LAVPEFPCNDCSVNTVPLEGDREYYEVWDELWRRAGAPGIGQSDHGTNGFYLCVGCLEARLRRRLKPADFKPYPANTPSPWLSQRLNDRLGCQPAMTKQEAPQYYPIALARAVLARYNPRKHVIDVTGAVCFESRSCD
jgi:hypothetical protein